MAKSAIIQNGNAGDDSVKGWFVGNFLPKSLGLRHSDDLEVKWGVHEAGEKRDWSSERRKTMTILVSGKIKQSFQEQEIVLERPGDYVAYYNVQHRWEALEPTTILTIRWPSVKIY